MALYGWLTLPSLLTGLIVKLTLNIKFISIYRSVYKHRHFAQFQNHFFWTLQSSKRLFSEKTQNLTHECITFSYLLLL